MQGITEKTLRRAQKEMGITATKDGYHGQWIWSFPFDAKSLFKKPEAPAPLKMDTKNKDTPPKNKGTFNDG